jgi:hypothetical protein
MGTKHMESDPEGNYSYSGRCRKRTVSLTNKRDHAERMSEMPNKKNDRAIRILSGRLVVEAPSSSGKMSFNKAPISTIDPEFSVVRSFVASK